MALDPGFLIDLSHWPEIFYVILVYVAGQRATIVYTDRRKHGDEVTSLAEYYFDKLVRLQN